MSQRQEGLSAWHLTMMALGTVIGGSFFLGSAIAIRSAGPGILIAYIFGGLLVYLVLTSLSEMTVADPAPGSFRTYAGQMYGPAAGFVVGWVYWTGLTLAMSSEATAVSVFLRAWFPGLSLSALSIAIIIAVTLINLVGAKTLSNLESGLALVKFAAIAGFILIGAFLIAGLIPGRGAVGLGVLTTEPLFPAGLTGIMGSMLIVMFAYAGFEVIGLAATETKDPHRTVPRAIIYTVLGLTGLYILSTAVLLPLVPTGELTTKASPMVSALNRAGQGWAGSVMNIILITAILSTMLAAMFGLGRMLRSLADEGYAPSWLKEKTDVPKRSILFSGAGMIAGVGASYLLPNQVYIFLVSSGGFSLLFAYLVIMATHYKFRRIKGCPPRGKCQVYGYPYTSVLGLISLVAIIVSMPLIPGQDSGLFAGLLLVVLYFLSYLIMRSRTLARLHEKISVQKLLALRTDLEAGRELHPEPSCPKEEPGKKNH